MFSRNFKNRATFSFPVFLLLNLTTEQVLASSNIIPLTLGPDFQRPYSDDDLLRGFKLNIAEGESPLKRHVFQGEIKPITFSTSYDNSMVVRSTQEIKDMLEIDGSLSVSYGPISGSGKGSYLDNRVSTKNHVSVLYRTRRVAFARKVDIKTLQIKDAEFYQLDSDEIADLYGTKFMDQIMYGAQLDVIYTVTSSEDIDIEEIEAELKGKIGYGSFSIEFDSKFTRKEGEAKSMYQMSIVTQASGIDVATPSNPTFDDVNTIINDFNTKYDALLDEAGSLDYIDDETNVLNQLSPVGFTLASIAEHAPILSQDDSAALDNKMDDLKDVFYNALFWKSQLKSIRGSQELMYARDPRKRDEIYKPYSDEMDDIIFRLDEKIEECLLYRQLPLENIIGKNGANIVSVPEGYPKSDDLKVAHGLMGDAYIKSPATVGTTEFPEIHYVGFALPALSGSGLEPWMGGMLRHDKNNTIFVAAETSQELERLGYAKINHIEAQAFDFVTYGDILQLQVNNVDSKWLSGNRHGDGIVITRNKLESVEFESTYEWVAQSTVIDDEEPKLNECIRYGDVIYLRNNSTEHEYLGEINMKLKTKDPKFRDGDSQEWALPSFGWIISSEYEISPDPAHGECVQTLSVVYLNNQSSRKLLSVGHSASNEEVSTRSLPLYFNERVKDGLTSSSCPTGTEIKSLEECQEVGLSLGGKLRNQEVVDGSWGHVPCGCSVEVGKDNAIHFDYDFDHCKPQGWAGVFQSVCRHNPQASQWIIRKNENGNGGRTDGFWCSAISAKGLWVPLEDTQVSKDVGYTVGIAERLNDDHPYWTHSESWETSVISSVGGGFMFGPSEIEVSWMDGSQLVDSVRTAVQNKDIANHTGSFGPGQVWQFIYDMDDLCDPLWLLKSDDLVVTPDYEHEPCCLPGFEADRDKPHGPCKRSSPCQCAEEICNPPDPRPEPKTPHPTTEPTQAPTDESTEDDPSAGTSWLVSRTVVFVTALSILVVPSSVVWIF